jgi:hypothetical protein
MRHGPRKDDGELSEISPMREINAPPVPAFVHGPLLDRDRLRATRVRGSVVVLTIREDFNHALEVDDHWNLLPRSAGTARSNKAGDWRYKAWSRLADV